MSLKNTILTSLIESEKSGYDIFRQFQNSLNYYWNASYQQIYKTLDTILEQGLVSVRTVKQEQKADKKLYSLTEKGIEELENWVHEPTSQQKTKNDLLVKLTLARKFGSAAIIKQLQQRLSEKENELLNYRKIERAYFTPKPSAETHIKNVTYYLALRNGITHCEVEINWLHESIDMLSSNQ